MSTRPTLKERKAAALMTAKSQGCTCDPDLVERSYETFHSGGALGHMEVQHDDWCALIARREGHGLN